MGDSQGAAMIKYRNLWMQVLLFIITLGIYGIYWFYSTTKEMILHQNREDSAALWTILGLIPLVNLFVHWKHSELVNQVANGRYSRWLLFVLWIFIWPAVWLIVQIELNKLATSEAQYSQSAPNLETNPG
jgi:hypothetical protein